MKKRSLIKLRDVDRRFEEMPAEKRNFRTQPLREQVYDYLMLKIRDGEIHPGASINLRKIGTSGGRSYLSCTSRQTGVGEGVMPSSIPMPVC